MYVTISSMHRAAQRASAPTGPGSNICKVHNVQFEIVTTGRSIHHPLFSNAGSGEVREVGEIYCPQCDGAVAAPAYGTPIKENQIVEIPGRLDPL